MTPRLRHGIALGIAVAIHVLFGVVFTITGRIVVPVRPFDPVPGISIRVVRSTDTNAGDEQSGAREAAGQPRGGNGPAFSRTPDPEQTARVSPVLRFRSPEVDRITDVEPLPATPEFREWAERNGSANPSNPVAAGPGGNGNAANIGSARPGGAGDPLAGVKLFQCLAEARQGKRGLECLAPGGRLFNGQPIGNFDPRFEVGTPDKPDCRFEFCDDEANFDKPPPPTVQDAYDPRAPETLRAQRQRIERR